MAAAALVLFLVGASSQAGWLYVIAAGFVGAVVAGMAAPPFLLRKISAVRAVVPRATVGDTVPVTVTLKNESRGRRGPLAGTDMLLGQGTFLIRALAPNSSESITLKTPATRRGAREGADLRLETGAPFGIATAARTMHLESPIVVHPRWVPLASFPLLESASTPNEALHERSRRGTGTDFYGLREYQPGDSVRRIHWGSSARSAGLLVREYEEHIGSRMSILIDGDVVGLDPETTFEAAVSCAASLVIYALDAGHPVQLFCPESSGIQQLFEPGKAEALDWLARIDPAGTSSLSAVAEFASSEIYRRSTNVLVFSTTEANVDEVRRAVANLQEMATRVIAVAVSARTYDSGGPALAEPQERDFLGSLAAMRVIVYSVEKGKELSECLKEPLLS